MNLTFEKHHIRGIKKMKVRCGIALCVMMAMAIGRIKRAQAEKCEALFKAHKVIHMIKLVYQHNKETFSSVKTLKKLPRR
jgi:hypothetical protein